MSILFREARLANGLTIIGEVLPAAHSAAAGFFVKTGARDEATPLMGVSHFLEHMMFKGTERRTAELLNRQFDEIGARNNAYTSAEMTCFHASVLPERLLGENGVLDILADMMRPALREADFTTEKNVILEEIAMYEDDPFWVLYERLMEEYYGPHGLSHRVLGTKGSITALAADQMRRYFFDRYSADNTVLAVAGNVDFDQVVEQIERQCGTWERTRASRDVTPPLRPGGALELRDEKVSRAYAMIMTPAPAMGDDRRYAASLLAQVLGGPDNSRLHWALVETGLAEDASAGYDPRDGIGDYVVSVACDPERLDEVMSVVDREIAALGRSLTEDDLEKIRAKLATSVTTGGERPGGRMQRIGRQWTYLGRYTTLEEELERITAVRTRDLLDVLEAFPFTPRTTGRMLPAE
ncbi:MAG: insulinase family protein [Phycisphaerales bacterium]|nr:insulinase family protein [Phycisphaerales bacterium]